MAKSDKTPKPIFNEQEYTPGARITKGQISQGARKELEQALTEHVYGQKVVKILVERKPDGAASRKHGKLIETIELSLQLENKIEYILRIELPFASDAELGEGLATIQ